MEMEVIEKQLNTITLPTESLCYDLQMRIHKLLKLHELVGVARIGGDRELFLDCVETAKKDTGSLLELLTDVVDTHRVMREGLPTFIGVFEAGSVLNSCNDFFRFITRNKQLSYICIGNLEGTYLGDECRICQMIFNVIDNAVKYNKIGGSILMEISKQQISSGYHWIKIKIRDTGVGISDEQKRNLFMPFAPMDQTDNGEYRRAGIGLSIAKYIVESMNGSIEIKSELSEGTEVILRFYLKRYEPVPSRRKM